MILTQCAVCATELGLTLGKKCGRCAGVAPALQTVAIDHHVAFTVDGVQVGLGSRPPPRWPPPRGGDDSD